MSKKVLAILILLAVALLVLPTETVEGFRRSKCFDCERQDGKQYGSKCFDCERQDGHNYGGSCFACE